MRQHPRWLCQLLAVLAVYCGPASAQTWQTYGNTPDGSWEIDLTRISMESGYARYWVRHLTPPKLFTNAKESLNNFAANCATRQIAVTSEIERDTTGRVIKQGTLAPNLWNFQPVAPGTIGEGALDLVCKRVGGTATNTSLLLPRLPTPPDWQFIASDDKSTYRMSISPKSVTKTAEGLVSAIGNTTYTATQRSPNGSEYLYFLFDAHIDCGRVSWDFSRQEYVSQNFLVTDTYEKNSKQIALQAVAPTSIAQQAIAYVCALPQAASAPVAKSSNEDIDISSGTGWVVANGRIVTAYHVVAGANAIVIYGPQKTPIEATLLSKDEKNDIAILAAKFDKWKPMHLALSRTPPRIGSRVFTIGFPHSDVLGGAPKFTAGEISANSGLADDPRIVQISVPVQSGNSGGPLLNARGEVVGLVTSKLDAMEIAQRTGDLPQNVNYAIKSRYVQGLMDDLGIVEFSSAPVATSQDLENVAARVTESVVQVLAARKK